MILVLVRGDFPLEDEGEFIDGETTPGTMKVPRLIRYYYCTIRLLQVNRTS